MRDRIRILKNNKYISMGVKTVLSIMILFFVLQNFMIDGLTTCYSVKEYMNQNEFSEEQISAIHANEASQSFVSKGSVLSSITLYLKDKSSRELYVQLSENNGETLISKRITLSDYEIGSWNTVAIDASMLERGKEYKLTFMSEQGLESLCVDSGESPEIFTACDVNGSTIQGGLVIGMHQNHKYLTWGNVLELAFELIFALSLAMSLCFTIIRFESIYEIFKNTKSKQGLLYAIYFAMSLVLMFNPLDSAKNEVDEFSRIIGAGLMGNVDVAKRISNFNYWFLCFAIAIVLFFMLANFLKTRNYGKEGKKVMRFLDGLIVLANVNLVFRCMTYFADESASETEFYYSSAIIALIVIMAVAYLALGMEYKVPSEDYLKLVIIVASLSYPVAILSQQEWQFGKLLFGIQAIMFGMVIFVATTLPKVIADNRIQSLMKSATFFLPLIPFSTSFYIELINILNQHNIFVTNLRRWYGIAVLGGIVISIASAVLIYKKSYTVNKWKSWAYPWLVFGITCLHVQIPLENTYSAHIFETANSSILISDFLNFGSIPLVEHYGGHMMTGVWEGLIYALLNQDYAGAIFSPYAGYIMTVLAVLFFYLIKKVWNGEMALLITLFFPFYNCWSYYGLGMLVCLAVMAYVKKNTYTRAMLLWGAFVWCAIYRLDLGFSFGLACMITMFIYVIVCKNWKAAKQLLFSLAGWVVVGVATWTSLCLAKEINPITRLIEFLMISSSNYTWAYSEIGNYNTTLFAWTYIFIPFLSIGCLLYTIISKKFREGIGTEKWLLLLILGIAYFTNFSRGLVRHSLAELNMSVVIWSAYIFLSIFFALHKRKMEIFLPVFAVLIMCNTFFTTTDNFVSTTIGDGAVAKMGEHTQTWTINCFSDGEIISGDGVNYWNKLAVEGKRVNRVVWDEDIKQTVDSFELVLDTILEEDETFVDFMNKTFVYSAINRFNPVYVSQSPLQLSGEFTQEQFVEQMEGIPVIIMPANDENSAYTLDGIANTHRNYKVAEYIYQNYVPLCLHEEGFAVWCLTERYDEMYTKLSTIVGEQKNVDEFKNSDSLEQNSPICYVDYGYDNEYHMYKMAYLPYIWAENDKASENKVLSSLNKEKYVYLFEGSNEIERKAGNYLMIEADYAGIDIGENYNDDDESMIANVKLGVYEDGTFEEKYQYTMVMKEGKHKYLLRVSSDYYWYADNINAVTISSDGVLYDVKMRILEGD